MPTGPLTDEEIAELRRLDRDADPIPWQGMGGWIRVDAPDSNADVDNFEAHPENEALVVAARNALPRLLDEVERVRAGAVTIRLEEDGKAVPFSAAVAEYIEKARALLKRLEWSRTSEATGSTEVSCPICKGPFGRHALDCELALLTWPTSPDRTA